LTPVEDMYTFYEEIVTAALVTQSFPHLKARLEVGRLKLRNRYVQAPFAVQSLAVIRELGLDRQRINPSGGQGQALIVSNNGAMRDRLAAPVTGAAGGPGRAVACRPPDVGSTCWQSTCGLMRNGTRPICGEGWPSLESGDCPWPNIHRRRLH
jgi:hypothetical protein